MGLVLHCVPMQLGNTIHYVPDDAAALLRAVADINGFLVERCTPMA